MTYNKKKKKRIRVDTIVFFFTNDRYFFYFNFDPLIFNFFDIIKSNLFFVKSSTNMMLEFFWDPENHKKCKSKQTINIISKYGIENKDFDDWKKRIKMKKKKKKNVSIHNILYMRKLLFSHIFYVIVNFNIKFKLFQLFFFLYLFEDLQ